MASPEFMKRWRITVTLLRRARRAIPSEHRENARIAELENQFEEFIKHNELELSLDCLEDIGKLVHCRGGFWKDLERAAKNMELNERAQYFHNQFLAAKP